MDRQNHQDHPISKGSRARLPLNTFRRWCACWLGCWLWAGGSWLAVVAAVAAVVAAAVVAAAAAATGASGHAAFGNGISASGAGAVKWCCCQRISATVADVGNDVALVAVEPHISGVGEAAGIAGGC